jgi:peptide/nickel transport system ATP-binding protein
MALLEVNNLHVRLQTQRGPAEAVRGVSFSLERGETLGLIGESGCGKSITVMALMGLLPDSARITGSIRFDGEELVGKKDSALCRIRGNRIGMIFQEPMTALNPVHSIGRQVAEPLRLHRGVSAAEARSRRSPCWTAWASRRRRGASTPTRTSSLAGSASASPLPWRWPAGPTC